MSMIDVAYSSEWDDCIDAIMANELWMEGVLTDKRAFECADPNCSAGITCKNMDKYPNERKQIPHFVMSSQTTRHDPNCQIGKALSEKMKDRKGIKGRSKTSGEAKTADFHIIRPKSHNVVVHQKSGDKTGTVTDSIRKNKKKYSAGQYKHKYFCLCSLVSHYISCMKKNNIDYSSVVLHNGRYKDTYKLQELFRRIERTESVEEPKKRYIYYGSGTIYSRDDGGYNCVFSECFKNSPKKVRCIIQKAVIEQCNNTSAPKLQALSKNIGKKKMIYVLGYKNDVDTKDIVFLNIQSIDHVYVSDIDLDKLQDELDGLDELY